jgi:hypothetical protein
MNKWTELSIEYANQRSYLDDLFAVYPTIPDGIREINEVIWSGIEKAFKRNDNDLLIRELLSLMAFCISKVTIKCINQLPRLITITIS